MEQDSRAGRGPVSVCMVQTEERAGRQTGGTPEGCGCGRLCSGLFGRHDALSGWEDARCAMPQ